MFIMIPALILGWIFASVAWWWAPGLSKWAKITWIVVSAAPLLAEGAILHWHFPSKPSETSGAFDSNNPLAALTDAQLREKTLAVAADLRAFGLRYNKQLALLGDSTEAQPKLAALRAERAAEFNQKFIGEIRMLQAALWEKLKIKGYQNPFSTPDMVLYGGDSVIRTGMLTGPDPISDVATYLETMANRLH